MNFQTGFLFGIFLKEPIINFLDKISINLARFLIKVKPKCSKQKVVLVCKIVDLELFDEYFPVLNTKTRVQPSWEYSKSKQIIKIEISEFDFNKPVSFEEFLDTTGIDIEFFETFCKMCLYVHYFIENREYINIYQSKQIIDNKDFELKETELSRRYEKLICAIFNNGNEQEIYITRYFKMFLNNNYPISTQQILSYNENINSLNGINGVLKLVDSKIIKLYSVNEKI
jgi:hypothetical protein